MVDLMIIFVINFLQAEKQTGKQKQCQQKYSICFVTDSRFLSLTL